MEEAAKNTAGVKDATVNFMMLKMIVEFEDGQDPKAVMKDVLKNCKKVEDDCEIYLYFCVIRRMDCCLKRIPALSFSPESFLQRSCFYKKREVLI